MEMTTAATVGETTSRAALADSCPDPGAAAAHLAELFEGHSRNVLGLCRALLREPDDAEDAAQQAFLSAYRALLAGTVPRDPAAWLATIAHNECRTRSRERMREPLAEHEAAAVDVHAEAVRAADVEALRQAIGSLPRQQRAAFLLREVSGFSYRELSVALGVSAPAVEALLVRARRKLRVTLGPAKAAVALPFGMRELLARLMAGGEAQVPAAAKIASVSAGVVVMAAGATSITGHRSASQHAAQGRPAVVRTHPRPHPEAIKPVAVEPRASVPVHEVASRSRPTTPQPVSSPPAPAPTSAPEQQQEHGAVSQPASRTEHESSGKRGERASHDSHQSVDSQDNHDQSSDSSSSDDGGDGLGDGGNSSGGDSSGDGGGD